MDMHPSVGPVTVVEGTLMDPQHVGHRCIEEAVEPAHEFAERRGQLLAFGRVE